MTTLEQHAHAAATLNSIGDAVLSTDLGGCVTYLNLAAETLTGWSCEAATGLPLADVFHIIDRDTRQAADDPARRAVQLNRTVALTPNCLLVRRDGDEAAIEDSTAPIHDENGDVVGAVIVFRHVGAALETSRQMTHLAQHDTLTGLPNRQVVIDRLTEAIALARRHGQPLGVLFVDADGFKSVNDSLGHEAGDQVLREIGGALTRALRQSDTVGRYGGDEFVVVLSELERAEDALLVARKLLKAIASLCRRGDARIASTVSIGVSVYPEHGTSADVLIANADAAMYAAKRDRPGSVRLFANPVAELEPEPPAVASAAPGTVAHWEAEGGAVTSPGGSL
jgi:diguanylate cyclase (GGDEF)-like protein/PAS domain S-box-containing protein